MIFDFIIKNKHWDSLIIVQSNEKYMEVKFINNKNF